jgi:hypothetical protein
MKPILAGMKFLVGFAVGDRPNEVAPSQPEAHAKPPAGGESAVYSASAAPSPKPGRGDRAYDVFVSYRRDKGSEIARYVAERLAKRGYRVFLDVDSLGSGEWGKELQQRIDECPDFVAVVTDGYFVRCANPDDVVRKEIARALETRTTVIPLFVGDSKIPADLPADITGISSHNGVKYLHEYANQAIDKMCGFMHSTPLLGPERLGTGEAQPRIVLLCVLFAIGVWRGAVLGDHVGYQGVWWLPPLFGLGMGLLCVPVIIVPTLVALTIYGKKRGISLDSLYAGPWTPFWVLVIPFMFMLTSLLVPVLLGLIGIRSFFAGGVLGGLVAIGITRFIVATNLWAEVTRALGFSARAGKIA